MKLPFNIDLKGKVAVVTGGTGVLCFEMAKSLAMCGAKVVLVGRNEEKLKEKSQQITDLGYEAIGISANVLDEKALKECKKTINDTYGTIDILVNGAGGNHPNGTTSEEYLTLDGIQNENIKSFYDLDVEGIKFVMDLNYIGTLLPTQVFSKDMVEKEEAVIINLSSMSAFNPLTKVMSYSGAKAAINNLTQWMAIHFSKTNIRVNAIAPGFFETQQNAKLLRDEDGNLTARADKIISQTPMGRFGEAEELLGALLFLVDKKASGFINGIVLPVDGGFSAYSGV